MHWGVLDEFLIYEGGNGEVTNFAEIKGLDSNCAEASEESLG
jgi:hypothetical protein